MKSLEELLAEHELLSHKKAIEKIVEPAIAFSVREPGPSAPPGSSKIGGAPDLPVGTDWPQSSDGRKLDFLLQIRFEELPELDTVAALPREGSALFFYDLQEQPWGYDPDDLDGFEVIYAPGGAALERASSSDHQLRPRDRRLEFRPMVSYPHPGSRAMWRLSREAGFDDDEWDRYCDFVEASDSRFYEEGTGEHRILGHSTNIQGDMQLEAALVTNGLYCGDGSGYEDTRRPAIEASCEEWRLLLQLDTDDSMEMMWGDCGMLYFWLRQQELSERSFENTWMTLQCF